MHRQARSARTAEHAPRTSATHPVRRCELSRSFTMVPTNEWSLTATLGYAYTPATLTRLFGLTHAAMWGTPTRPLCGATSPACSRPFENLCVSLLAVCYNCPRQSCWIHRMGSHTERHWPLNCARRPKPLPSRPGENHNRRATYGGRTTLPGGRTVPPHRTGIAALKGRPR
jgi:hypothetical protein